MKTSSSRRRAIHAVLAVALVTAAVAGPDLAGASAGRSPGSGAGSQIGPAAGTASAGAIAVATGVATTAPLRVATYNVKCANCFDGLPHEKRWADRRGAVVSAIKAENLDVVGLQEASQGWLKVGGRSVDLSQFEDLRNRLGSAYALTDTSRNNCVKSTTPTRCVRKDQGASQGTKIVYNRRTLDLLASGSRLLPSTDSISNARYVAWAIFRQRSTGRKFFFADTHLEAGRSTAVSTLRLRQAQAVVAEITRRNPQRLPTFVVGDFNSSRFAVGGNHPYDAFRRAGYRDPLGQAYRTTRTAPGAFVQQRRNTWLSSFNGFERKAGGNRAWVNGSYIDYIMMTRMRVSEWETVARLDSRGRFLGTIPSDHNLLKATVHLP